MSVHGFGKFVEISKSNLHLSLYRGFLEISERKTLLSRIPLDDILGLLITGHGCSHSSNILVALADRNIPVSVCGSNFLPKALVLPVVGNCRQGLRIREQSKISESLKKKLWKQIVHWKLSNQADVLKQCELSYEWLVNMSRMVRSGDPENLEAQGARRYWISLFSNKFKRDKDGDGVNSMLNYAYAIIRSCVARGVVAAGLHPSIGIHHKNIYNPMCLVDDFMEPFRPVGDYVVKQLYSQGYSGVNKEVKHILSGISTVDILCESTNSPLFQVIARFSTSTAQALSGEKQQWNPSFKLNWNNFNIKALDTKKMLSSA